MKNPTKFIALLSGAALLSASFPLVGNAVATAPVGYVTVDMPVGTSLLSTPLLGEIQYTGTAGVVAGAVLNLSGLPATVSTPSYVHVTSGTAVGAIASITSSDATSITLEGAISGLAEGDVVRIVEHATLAHLTSASGSTVPDSTTVTVYNSDGTQDTYTCFSDLWYDALFASADNVILFPGEGAVVNLQGATTFVFTGNVNTVPVEITLTTGVVNLVGSVNPSAPTGSDSLGGALSSLADSSTITVYSEDGGLSQQDTDTLFSGVWYDALFAPQEISVAAPSVIVVNPQGTASVALPAAYTSN